MADGVYLNNDDWSMLSRMLKHYRQNGLWRPAIQTQKSDLPTPRYLHNDSGEEIPPYACCQVTGTEEIGGQNFLVVDKPADTTGEAGWFAFNGPAAVADDEEGKYQSGPEFRAFKDTGTVTGGERWAPVVDEWYLAQVDGGIFVAAGSDDVETDVLKVFVPGVGIRLYRFTMNEDWGDTTSGAADSDILEMDGTDTGTDADVLDPLGIFGGISNGDAGLCIRQGGSYWVIAPFVTGIRWDDPDLEQSYDGGSSWDNIDTAEDC